MFTSHHSRTTASDRPEYHMTQLNTWGMTSAADGLATGRALRMFRHTLGNIASPVYYASLLGLDEVLRELTAVNPENDREKEDLIKAHGGFYSNALQAASCGGRETVVQMLLDAGGGDGSPGW
ncbi:hypothetical protein V1515DRAFT_633639 [Lipomyces mesembrius]